MEHKTAFNTALALESAPKELFDNDTSTYQLTSDQLVEYARIVAYKTFHNLMKGFGMDRTNDPISVDDIPAPEVWPEHYEQTDSSEVLETVEDDQVEDETYSYGERGQIGEVGCQCPGAKGVAGPEGTDGIPKTMGEIAYNAYCATTNWKSVYTGADLPEFGAQKPEVMAAWEEAGSAVAEVVYQWSSSNETEPCEE